MNNQSYSEGYHQGYCDARIAMLNHIIEELEDMTLNVSRKKKLKSYKNAPNFASDLLCDLITIRSSILKKYVKPRV